MCKGYQQNERDRLKIKAFYLQFSFFNSSSPTRNVVLPDSLTLHYLPRISESPLEINDSRIRSTSPGFVTLHRVVSSGHEKVSTRSGVIYGSRDRVKASEGVRFEIYVSDVKVLTGIFRKHVDDDDGNWRVDCNCALENDDLQIKAAEVCVAVEGRAAAAAAEMISEKVEMTVKRRRRRQRCFQGLEDIPEQREVELESDFDEIDESDCSTCSCSECSGDEDMHGGGDTAEGVGWALDVGIWAMCLGVGVGYLVTRASTRSLRPRRFM